MDIGSDTVKMLQLRSSGGELSVNACARWKIPAAVRDDSSARDAATIDAVKGMLQAGKFQGRNIATALSCSQLSMKNIRLPRMLEGELAEAVNWEASERFSFDVAPDRIKYLRAGEVRQGNEVQDEIIMLAVSAETVEHHISLLERMGVVPVRIGAEPVELLRAFERRLTRRSDQGVVNVFLDIGAASTKVVVASGRHIVFIKNIDIAGKNFTDSAAKQLNLSTQQADELRSLIMKEHAAGGTSASDASGTGGIGMSESVRWTIHDAVRAELESLAREVALCLRYCSVTFRGIRPESVTVTGGQAYDPSVLKLLSEQLGVDCQVGKPLWGVELPDSVPELDRRGAMPEWALCVGLAMRETEGKDIGQELGPREHRLSA